MSRSTLKIRKFFIIIGLFFIEILSNPAFASNTYCVDAAASSAGTGSCWSKPFKELSAALNVATTDGDQILVAQGTYKPSGSTRTCTFLLNTNGIGVYGGYPSGGGVRDAVNNPTILSGDIGVANDISDNCYHVITIGTNVKVNAVLDGFTITSGNANANTAMFPHYLGGGIVSKEGGSLTLSNLTLTNNYALKGGGMYNQSSSPILNNVVFSNNFATDSSVGRAGGLYNYSNSSPILHNVSFIGNSSALDGGGMYNSTNSAPVLDNITFQSNVATGNGGGMYNHNNSNANLSNTTFSGNSARNHAGAIYNNASNTVVVNSTFSGNTAITGNGGAIYNDTGTQNLHSSTFTNNTAAVGTALYNNNLSNLTISNSIFWGNSAGVPIINNACAPSISYSVVEHSNGSGLSWLNSVGVDAGYNLDSNPLLSDLGNYGGATQTHALLPNSIAIDAGNVCTSADQRGLVRVGICDMGAFESQGFILNKVSGDSQSATINTSFANPLVVTLSSIAGEPVAGGTVKFTDLGATAKTTLSSAQTVNLGSNSANLAAPTANGIPGNYTVQASVRGASLVNFNLTNTAVSFTPAAPSSLTATAISATQINLTWVDNSNNETGFKVESPAGTVLNSVVANSTTYSHTGLSCGTTYNYSVKAINPAGDSTAITASASTAACSTAIPNAPSSLTATAISATQINLIWVDNSNNETAFKVESPVGTVLNSVVANSTTYSHTGLSCGTTYNYSVKAINPAGDSTAITASASTAACSVVIPNYNLNVISAGTGLGVVSGTPAGSYPNGTSISLSALASTGSIFTGWSPSLCGTAFNLTANLNCTAVFDSALVTTVNYTLTVSKMGTGTGIISGTTVGTYPANTVINLTAVANEDSSFMGWSPNNCASFNLNQNTTCTAIFDSNASATVYNFNVKTLGNGAGIVGGTPAGKYAQNTAVNLLAVADSNSEFAGWTPSSCANTFQLTADSTCVATFNLKTVQNFNLALNKTGTGTGSILGTATGVYPKNTAVNLVAVADNSSEFTTWNPSSCGNTFNLLADTYCTANFTRKANVTYQLSIAQVGSGSGTITGTVAGSYPHGTVVSLLATAKEDSLLTGWSPINCGATFTLNADTQCTAVFDKKPASSKPTYNLTLLSSGANNASLIATPAAPYTAGTQVKLTATAPNAQFLGWQGNGCDSSLTIERDLICVANFQTIDIGRVRVIDDLGNALVQLSEQKTAHSIKMKVARVGGNKGVITVHYQTQAGTALANEDYQTTGGTLVWGDLDNSVKTIEIPVLKNPTHYGDHYFYLLLNTDNLSLELDTYFVKLTLQDSVVQVSCNNASQLDVNGKLQSNSSCFTHRVNEIELEEASLLPNTSVHIKTLIETNPQYLGQYAEVLIVAIYYSDAEKNPISLQRRDNKWFYWSGELSELSAVTRYASLPKQITVDVFDGVLNNVSGYFKVYVGYRLAEGNIVFNGLNILKVNVAKA